MRKPPSPDRPTAHWPDRLLRVALDWTEPGIEWIIRLCGWSAILFVFSIFFFVFREAAPVLFGKLNLIEFFTSARWQPSSEVRPEYGVLGAVGGHAVSHGPGDAHRRAAGTGGGRVHLRILRRASSRKR